MNRFKKVLSYVVCFITGAVTLIIELICFRLLAPYFGNSNYVTGIIINAVLLGLAVGYYIGGYTADKNKNFYLPFILIFISTVYLFIIYLTHPFFLDFFGRMYIIAGVSLSVLAMFFLPVILLAFIPTYFIRILASEGNMGKTAGKIYSLSTFGSIIGGFCTTFLLIPYIGSSRSFLMCIIILFIISLIGFILHSRKLLLFLMIIPLFIFLKPPADNDYLYSTESEYNIIKVKRLSDDLYLFLNNYYAYFSKSLNKDMLSESYYDYFLLGPLICNTKEILILGNGAGTSMSQLSYFFNANITGVEIDKTLTKIGKIFFNLKTVEKTKIIHEDARVFVNNTDKKYDNIIIDLYNGSTYVPFHLATVQFFKSVSNILSENGVVIVNIPFYASGTILEEYYINSIQQSFKYNFIIDNVLFAFKSKIDIEIILNKIKGYKDNYILKNFIDESASLFKEYDMFSSKLFFTDDISNIENLTFSIINQ